MSLAHNIKPTSGSPTPPHGQGRARSRVLTLVFTDLVGSTALKGKLGDTAAAEVIGRHFSCLRALAFETGGREIVALGDGLFLSFEAPSAAVEFALNLQQTHFSQPDLPPVRIGIHLGEVTEQDGSPHAAVSIALEGLAVDLCARIQGLALPRQILLSHSVFDSARQRLRSDQFDFEITWVAHGQYLFKGYEQGIEIYEAGIEGKSPLVPPLDTEKARRDAASLDENLLGWRPAQGLELPGRPNWLLTEKLGEGGFGDVWLTEHCKTREKRVVKFCYSPERLRALKREVTLFRLLKESLGERDDIARVMDYQFIEPPYFLEMEYGGPNNLQEWLERPSEGAGEPLEVRLAIVAQIADAIGAAHGVGVLHKDIKPNNILVSRKSDGGWQARVIDFGIGALANRDLLEQKGITAGGLTEASDIPNPHTLSGTRLYMAPEVLEGKPATIQSDIFSLGVLLYQVITGKLEHALAPGWERDIEDPLLQQDIALCVDGVPDRRFASARELAERLRTLPKRRILAEEEKKQVDAALRRRRRRPLYWVAAGALFLVIFFSGLFTWQLMERVKSEGRLRAQAEVSRKEAVKHALLAHDAQQQAEQAQYFSTIQMAAISIAESRIEKAREVLLADTPSRLRRLEWGLLYARTSQDDFSIRQANAFDAMFSPDGTTLITGSMDNRTQGKGWLTVFDARTGRRLRGGEVNDRLVWDFRFSPDGRQIITASSDHSATIVDLETLTPRFRLKGHTGIVRASVFSPDNSMVFTAARDNTIRQWNAITGEVSQVIPVPGQNLTDLQISPTGVSIASASLSGRVCQWDTATGELLAEFPGHGDAVLSICFGQDNSLITTCRDGLVREFPYFDDGSTSGVPPLRTVSPANTWPSAVTYSPVGNFLAVACDNGECFIYPYDTFKPSLRFLTDEPAWKIDVSPDAKSVVVTSRWSVRKFNLERINQRAQLHPYRGEQLTTEVLKIKVPGIAPEREVTWTFDREWRTTAGRTLVSFGDLQFAADSFFSVFSPDDRQCIRIHDQTLSATVVEVPSAKVLAELGPARTAEAIFGEDGRLAATASMQSFVQIWDTSNWQQLHLLDRKANSPGIIRFSPDASKVVVGYNDGIVIIWDTATGEQLVQTGTPGYRAFAMQVSRDGRMLGTGHSSNRSIIWDMETGNQISVLSGHVRYVHSLEFSPDGGHVLTAARDATAKLWDTKSGRELATAFDLSGQTQVVTAFFVPGTYKIGALTGDKTLLLTDYFPWQPQEYPGTNANPLDQRIELWKRRQRIDPNLTMADLELH